MQIGQVIRKLRKEKNMTQEQVAGYLGVSAPAVNKWESGSSYPDITLLPALARLLGTDLNTLLSFQEDLTPQEIALFLNTLSRLQEQEGMEAVYDTAEKKLREFPSCSPLVLNVALFLEGAAMMDKAAKEYLERRGFSAERLYERVLKSEDGAVREQALSMLISKYMGRKEYEKAQKLLDTLPDTSPVDKKQRQASLYLDCGKVQEAARLVEEKLLQSATGELPAALMTLMEIAIKENRMEDAGYLAEVAGKLAELFDLWEYSSYVARFELYAKTRNREKCMEVLVPMLKSLKKKWEPGKSKLYCHLEWKEEAENKGEKMQKMILQSLQEEEEFAFLREDPRWPELEKRME